MHKSKRPVFSQLDKTVLDSELFQQAITHRSASKRNNECLEFLGDSVLSTVITEYLYKQLPEASEGDLSRLRASLVNGVTLGQIGEENELGDFLHLGSGELRSGGHRRHSIMEDALEAIIGSLFFLKGYEYTREYVLTLFASRLEDLPDPDTLKDPKTRLQERLQGNSEPIPVYEVIDISGQAHLQTFTAECRIESRGIVVSGQGTSRRKAEQAAASSALEQLTVD